MSAFCNTTQLADGAFRFRKQMRAVPTLTATAGDWQIAITGAQPDATAVALNGGGSLDGVGIRFTDGATGLTAGEAAVVRSDATTNRALEFSAEL